MQKRIKEIIHTLYSDIKGYLLGVMLAGLLVYFLERTFGRVCTLVILLGFPCPACGMTRAALLLLNGRILDAFYMQPILFLILLGVIIVFVFRYFLKKSVPYLKQYMIVVCILMIVLYGYRMYHYFPDKEPVVYYEQNIINRLYKKEKID